MTITRRKFCKFLAEGAIVLGILKLVSLTSTEAQKDVIRPPGAVDEVNFNLLCVRCGICLEVCPTKTIVYAGFQDGIMSVNTPKIDPLIGPCEFFRGRCEETMLCSKYCPTDALQLVNKELVKLGTVDFNPESCLAFQGKECVVCDEMCPVPEAITITEDLKPVFHRDKCIGCGACVNSCPAIPNALTLLPKDVKRIKWLR